jgi:hypothetical protein
MCTVKNTYSCCHESLLSAEKTSTSLSQIQPILESLEVEKPGFFHVRSLHCCCALLMCWSRKLELLCRLSKERINLGKPQGVGISEWETDGEQMGSRWGGREMRRSVYEQPGTMVEGSYCSKEGSK